MTARRTIHPTAWVAPWVTLGHNVVIGPNCSIGWEGFGYETDQDGRHHRRHHAFGVVIGDDVEIGAGCTIDRGRYRDTVIGAGTKIDANVFIAHNCLIGENCLIVANSQISGSCEIGDRCHIGPAAMLTDHVKVGDGGRCGLGAVVIRDVPAGVTVVGNPARDIEERRRDNASIAKVAQAITNYQIGNARTGGPGIPIEVEPHPGSHGDIRGVDWDEAFGDGCEFSLPVSNGHSELEQRQRAARKGWMGAERSSGRR